MGAENNLHLISFKGNCFARTFTYVNVFQPGFRTAAGFSKWLLGVPLKQTEIPLDEIATTVVAIPLFHKFMTETRTDACITACGYMNTQTFAEGSAAKKWLKNTDVRQNRRQKVVTNFTFVRGGEEGLTFH